MKAAANNRLRIKLPALTAYQAAHIFHPARTVVIEASTKSGKTLGCILWQANQVLTDTRGMDHWWVAPVYSQAQIAYRRAKIMLPSEIFTCNDSDHRLDFANGARWWFKSGEKPDNLYGEDVASAVVDEASRCREEAYTAIRSTLTATGGPVRIIGNVKGRRNWAWRAARRAEAGDPEMHYARFTADDAAAAGIFPMAEVESAQRDLPDAIFRELYYAEAADDQGNPFGLDAIRACIGDLSPRPVEAWGVDLAKSVDWTVAIGLDAAGNVARFERFQRPWGDTIRAIGALIGDDRAFIDSTGVGDPIVEQLQKAAPKITGYKFSAQSKQQLMDGLSLAIQRGAVRYPEGVIVAELEAFEYTYSRTGVSYAAPEGLHDDAVMALALAIACQADRKALWAPVRPAEEKAAEMKRPEDIFIPAGYQ